MANRQEEFLNKLETNVRKEWLYLAWNMTNPEFPLHQKASAKILRRANSILVKTDWISPLVEATVTVEKSDNDLVVISEGFKHRRIFKITQAVFYGATIFFWPLFIISLYLLTSARPEKLVHPPDLATMILLTIVAEAIMLVFLYHARKNWKRGLKGQSDALIACIHETINSFKETPRSSI